MASGKQNKGLKLITESTSTNKTEWPPRRAGTGKSPANAASHNQERQLKMLTPAKA